MELMTISCLRAKTKVVAFPLLLITLFFTICYYAVDYKNGIDLNQNNGLDNLDNFETWWIPSDLVNQLQSEPNSSFKQAYQERLGALSAYSKHMDLVPNIVHFIWFAKNGHVKLTFINYVSVLSAHRIQNASAILFHCNHLPTGKWWDRMRHHAHLHVSHLERPTTIHGKKLDNVYHAGDIAKLNILHRYGGIYLDLDVIIVKNMDSLRRYDFTFGKEIPPKINAGIILSKPGASFLRIWYESYKDYRPGQWVYNAGELPYQLAVNHADMVHLELHSLTASVIQWVDSELVFDIEKIDSLFVVHVCGHGIKTLGYDSPEFIKSPNTTLGYAMRLVYYGSIDAIKEKKIA